LFAFANASASFALPDGTGLLSRNEDIDLDKYKDCYFLSVAPTGSHNNDDDADKRCASLQAQSLVLTSDRGCSETSETVCSSEAAFAFDG
jgi:hypothetical protein